MSETIKNAEGACIRTLELLNRMQLNKISKRRIQELQRRIQSVKDTLIEKEGKLWLRTLDGKKLSSVILRVSSKFGKRIQNILESNELKSIENNSCLLCETSAELEKYANILKTEIKRRRMVLT